VQNELTLHSIDVLGSRISGLHSWRPTTKEDSKDHWRRCEPRCQTECDTRRHVAQYTTSVESGGSWGVSHGGVGSNSLYEAFGLLPQTGTPTFAAYAQATHHPHPIPAAAVERAMYLFGDPVHGVTSILRRNFCQAMTEKLNNKRSGDHCNMSTYASEPEDRFRISEQFSAWTEPVAPLRYPLLLVSMDRHWDHLNEIGCFLGRKPKTGYANRRRSPSSLNTDPMQQQLLQAKFARLIKRQHAMPPLSIVPAGSRHAVPYNCTWQSVSAPF